MRAWRVPSENWELDSAGAIVLSPLRSAVFLKFRSILPSCEFDAGPCAEGLKALRASRKEWEEECGSSRDSLDTCRLVWVLRHFGPPDLLLDWPLAKSCYEQEEERPTPNYDDCYQDVQKWYESQYKLKELQHDKPSDWRLGSPSYPYPLSGC